MQYEEALAARLHLFDSWRRVLEVTVFECYHHLAVTDVEPYLFELIELLLWKQSNAATSDLALLEAMADACLVLITKLREQIGGASQSWSGMASQSSSQPSTHSSPASAHRFSRTPVSRLHSILTAALACVVDKTPSSVAVRTHARVCVYVFVCVCADVFGRVTASRNIVCVSGELFPVCHKRALGHAGR